MMRSLILAVLGQAAPSTAREVGKVLEFAGIRFRLIFHKLTGPPFQEQYAAEQRRTLLKPALASHPNWILSNRQRKQFESRIDAGGDLEKVRDQASTTCQFLPVQRQADPDAVFSGRVRSAT